MLISDFRNWTIGATAVGFSVLYVGLVGIVWRGWRIITSQRNQLVSLNAELESRVEDLRETNQKLNAEIAQRREIEEGIRLQSAVTANMAEGVCLVRSSDGALVYVNAKFNNMFGYNENELIGKKVSALNAPGERSPNDAAMEIKESLNKEGRWQGEVHNIKKNGAKFWSHVAISTFEHHEYGMVWVSVLTDITHGCNSVGFGCCTFRENPVTRS